MKKNVLKLLAAVLCLSLLFSLTSLTVFAATEPDDTGVSGEPSDADGASDDNTADAPSDTNGDAADDSTDDTEAVTDADTDAAVEDDHDHDHSDSGRNTYWLPTLIVLAVIIIACVIWVLRDRERALKLWRSFKSEFKKVVWSDPHQTMKNTILVVIAIVAFAIIFGIIDYLLSLGVVTLGSII